MLALALGLALGLVWVDGRGSVDWDGRHCVVEVARLCIVKALGKRRDEDEKETKGACGGLQGIAIGTSKDKWNVEQEFKP